MNTRLSLRGASVRAIGDMDAGRAAVEDQRVAVANQIAHARGDHPLRLEILLHAALKRRLIEPVR
jgi:hypothetical protein